METYTCEYCGNLVHEHSRRPHLEFQCSAVPAEVKARAVAEGRAMSRQAPRRRAPNRTWRYYDGDMAQATDLRYAFDDPWNDR